MAKKNNDILIAGRLWANTGTSKIVDWEQVDGASEVNERLSSIDRWIIDAKDKLSAIDSIDPEKITGTYRETGSAASGPSLLLEANTHYIVLYSSRLQSNTVGNAYVNKSCSFYVDTSVQNSMNLVSYTLSNSTGSVEQIMLTVTPYISANKVSVDISGKSNEISALVAIKLY